MPERRGVKRRAVSCRTFAALLVLTLIPALAACTGSPSTPSAAGRATAGFSLVGGSLPAAPRTRPVPRPTPTLPPVRTRTPPSPSGPWRPTTVPAALRSGLVTIRAMAARNQDDAWAVGARAPSRDAGWTGDDDDLIDPQERPVALHWNGRRWLDQPLPAGISRLTSVAAGRSGEAWAVGLSATKTNPVTRLLHWSAGRWQEGSPATGSTPAISKAAQVQVVAGDGRGRVYLGGSDRNAELVAQWEGTHWRRLPAPPTNGAPGGAVSGPVRSGDPGLNVTVSFLSVAPGSRLWAGASPRGFDATLFTSWDGDAWYDEDAVAGSHVVVGFLDALDDGHVWYNATLPFVGMAFDNGLPFQDGVSVDVMGRATGPGQSAPSTKTLPAVLTAAGHYSVLQWAAGRGVLARYQGRHWVRDRTRPVRGVKPALLAAIPGARGTWLAGTTSRGLVLLRHR